MTNRTRAALALLCLSSLIVSGSALTRWAMGETLTPAMLTLYVIGGVSSLTGLIAGCLGYLANRRRVQS